MMTKTKWKIINFIETTKHKFWVFWYMLKVCGVLLKRAVVHDMSKYSEQERSYFEKAIPKLQSLTYGSDRYKETLEELQPALNHHYHANSHHPEYHGGDVKVMPRLDQIEMLCDWAAATRRHDDGNLQRSVEINKDRFHYGYETASAFQKDIKEIGLG